MSKNATFKTPWTALSAKALRSGRNASRVRGAVNERPCIKGRMARRPPVNGTSPKTSSAGWHCCCWRKRNALHPRTDALRLHCDAHLGVTLDGLTTCPGQPIIAELIRYTHAYVWYSVFHVTRRIFHQHLSFLFANVLENGWWSWFLKQVFKLIGLFAKERALFEGHVVLGSTTYVGKKSTVMMYTYINRHAEPPNITKQKTL